jgi:hypothetical protein
VVDRLLRREDPDALGAPDPDGVPREHRVDFLQRAREGATELAEAVLPPLGNVGHHAADAGHARREPGAGPRLLQVVHPLALLERPEERREGPEVDAGGAQPDEVRDDAVHLARDHAQHAAPLGDLDPHQLLDRQREADVVAHRRQVVGPVGQRDDLVVEPVLAELLESGVQVPDVRDAALDGLALELEHQPQDAVGRGMLGADVDEHVLGAEILVVPRRRVRHAERRSHRPSLRVDSRCREGHLHRAQAHRTSPRSPRLNRS